MVPMTRWMGVLRDGSTLRTGRDISPTDKYYCAFGRGDSHGPDDMMDVGVVCDGREPAHRNVTPRRLMGWALNEASWHRWREPAATDVRHMIDFLNAPLRGQGYRPKTVTCLAQQIRYINICTHTYINIFTVTRRLVWLNKQYIYRYRYYRLGKNTKTAS